MWNNTIKKLTLLSLSVIVIFTLRSYAVNYTITSLTSHSATISFTIGNADKRSTTTDQTLIFAITSHPTVTVSGSITALNGMTCRNNNLSLLSNGWMGKDFLQWFSITLQIEDKNRLKNKKVGGTISLSFSRPIIKNDTRVKNLQAQNCIIKLPMIKTSPKRVSVSKPYIPYSRGIRMETTQDGIYQITGNTLKKLGAPIERVLSKSYRLFCKDKEVPIYISNSYRKYLEDNDVILFYGKFLRGENHYYTQYSYANVYWLTWGGTSAGARVAEASGELKIDPSSFNPEESILAKEFTDTIHLEVDYGVIWMGSINIVEETEDAPLTDDEIDNWYWAGIGEKKLTNFMFSLPSPVKNSSFNLKIFLTGLSSDNTIQNDHKYSIALNDKEINASAIWDGYDDYEFVVQNISSNVLNHGNNNLTLICEQIDTIPDRGALNWFEISYTRGFEALNNTITFRNNTKDINKWIHFDLTGFTTSDLELWDISKSRKFKHFVTGKAANTNTLSFQDSMTSPTRYYAQARSLRLTPDNMVLDTISDDWDFPAGIDYIMVTPDNFILQLQPLIDVHTQSGLKVEAIDLQDIYNRFSYGIRDPESIRTMLSYVFNKHITDPPKYLLLCGDGSHDMDKKGGAISVNIVPTHLTRVPNWGPASNDDYFATIYGDDNFPDLHVGRFPAHNVDMLNIIVDKTVNYLLYLEHGYWRDNLILAGGYEPEFTALNNELISDIIGPKMNIFRMDADPQSPYYTSGTGASNKMAGYINAGAYAIHFTGHGGGNTWSDSKFFSYTDITKLHNSQWSRSGRLPIIFSFTCLTGFFESNSYSSLGEEFLRHSADGCISFYGASAYTRKNIDLRMAKTLWRNAMNNSFESLGELLSVTEMLMLVMNASEALPLTRQYNLLGDPALPWKLTLDTLMLSLENTNLKGTDTLKVSGKTLPVISGNVKLSVTAENNIPWAELITTVSDSSFSHNFILKASSQTAHGLVRAFAWNDSSEVMGWAYFSKDTFTLYDVTITPAEPALGDSVSIMCKIESRDSLYVPLVQCRYTIEDPQEQNITFDDTSYVFMEKDTATDFWYSTKKLILGSSSTPFDVTKYLILKFFATENLGASDFFYFKLKGRPDLTFTGDTLDCMWRNDSLYVECEVLNEGNAPAPPFSVTFYGYSSPTNDTIFHGYSTNYLNPSNVARFSFSIPDTQGTLRYTGEVNLNHTVEEISYSNNTTLLNLTVTYADLRLSSDTLFSIGRGCYIVPFDTLLSTHRVFLFPDTLNKKSPLQSASEWLPLLGDGLSGFHIHARPALYVTDSFQWIFQPSQADAFVNVTTDSGFQPGIFVYNSLSSQWLNKGGTPDTQTNTMLLNTNEQGPLALGTLTDNISPEIRVFVAGKEILFLDYAAKNKPFNIFITDSSGIAKSSIQLLLNSNPLASEYKSSGITGENPSTVILTAYPQKMNAIDSLTVIAEDNAGNRAEKVFTYRPGEKLKIKFFSCHPNPFTAKPGKLIRFPYLLTDVATKVTLTIYTISGRKVWRWKSSTESIGYQEIAWDGTTQNRRNANRGYRIANGTYYAKLVAQNNHRKVEKIIRIAKLEGY